MPPNAIRNPFTICKTELCCSAKEVPASIRTLGCRANIAGRKSRYTPRLTAPMSTVAASAFAETVTVRLPFTREMASWPGSKL